MAEPVTMSPPANTPFLLVSSVFSSATILPRLVSSSPLVLRVSSGLALVPTETITASTWIRLSEPSLGTGRRRPLSSGSPNSMSMTSISCTQPRSSPMI